MIACRCSSTEFFILEGYIACQEVGLGLSCELDVPQKFDIDFGPTLTPQFWIIPLLDLLPERQKFMFILLFVGFKSQDLGLSSFLVQLIPAYIDALVPNSFPFLVFCCWIWFLKFLVI